MPLLALYLVMSFWSETLLSDIATAQPRLQNTIHSLSSQTILHNKFVYRNEKQLAFPWKSLCIPQKAYNFELGRIHRWRGRLVIKAVATLEPTRLNQRSKEFNLKVDVDSGSSTVSNGVGQESSSEDSTELNYREKLRRMRISKANKGNTPWNKGKKHSPETLQRIRERTRLAMQDPKVKMKLVNLGHAQSEETRMKIGIGVRIGWEKRREMLMLQETCVYEWQNLIAEASRRGMLGEEELQWNSYKILDKQLEQEWVQSVEERKRTPRVKGSKRAPKSLEQRRKISESISAKWADPSYRNRVCSALAKYHGITEGVERKPRRKPSADGQTRKRSPLKKKVDSDDFEKPEPRSQIQRVRLKRSSVASYKDPLASTKLEMLKNIRAQRAAAESKKTEAISRAKVLIAEAEKAARALEVAAKTSPLAQVSLVETRKLIAEAIQSVSSIEEGQEDSQPDGKISLASPELVAHSELTMSANFEDPNQIIERKVNGYGSQTLASSDCDFMRFNFEKPPLQDLVDASSNSDSIGFNFEKPPLQDLEAPSSNADPMELNFERPPQQDLLDCTEKLEPSSTISHDLVNGKENTHQTRPSDYSVAPTLLNNGVKRSSFTQHLGDLELNGSIDRADSAISNGVESQSSKEEKPPKSATVTKKWVRGRLVEVDDGSLG